MPEYGQGANPEKEILLAGGKLEYCTSITGEITAGTFVNVGYTAKDAGGVFNDKQPTFKEVKVTGLPDAVKRKATDRDVTLKVTILQTNLTNIALACGASPSDIVAGKYKGGGLVDAATLKWKYTVPNEDDPTKAKKLTIPQGKVIRRGRHPVQG